MWSQYVNDVLAFPSHEESFGNVLLEAMAMNVPVVASSGGGVPDIVIHKKTGILVDPKNAKSLAQGLLQMVLDEKKRIAYADAARVRVIEYFSDDSFVMELLRHYEML